MIIGPVRELKTLNENANEEIRNNEENIEYLSTNDDRIEYLEEKIHNLYRERESEYPTILRGVLILVIGFILQAIGAGWQLINSID